MKEAIKKVSLVTIDLEYPGHDAAVKEHLLNLLRRAGFSVDANMIEFQIHRGGRKPAAHDKAYLVFLGVAEPDQIITAEELLEQFK